MFATSQSVENGSIFALPVLDQYLIYASLHGFAALVDHLAAQRIRDGLLSTRNKTPESMREIMQVLESRERLVRLFRTCFAASPETEWALESTVFDLAPEMLSILHELGFTQLHIGVQTLNDEIRQVLNRRATADEVLATIAGAIGLGWIVSVDLVYGLPGQTLFVGNMISDLLARCVKP